MTLSILDKMRIDNSRVNFRRPEDPHGVIATVSQEESRAVAPHYNGFTYEQAYKTELRATTMWYANEAQFNMRYDIARKELLHYIYGPVISRLNDLRARAYDRDYREVLRVVDELEKELVE